MTAGAERRLKGVYLIPDPHVMKPDYGPSEHVRAGIRELRKSFDMIEVVLGDSNELCRANTNSKEASKKPLWGKESKALGLLRDLKRLITNHLAFWRYYRQIKRLKPDFIYERSEYLNFTGLLCAKLMKVPHFYELNWVHFLGMRQFYALFLPLSKRLERMAYENSSHCFMVGDQNQFLNLKSQNWTIFQNGIAEDVLLKNRERENIANGTIEMCMVSNLMPYHRFDLLVAALKKVSQPEQFRLHLIGFNFESVLLEIPKRIWYVHHGSLDKAALEAKLKSCHVGLILGGWAYSSFLKLYEYAAAKLLVICPDLANLKSIFGESDVLFFKEGDANDLARRIDQVVQNPSLLAACGESIYDRVLNQFTWEKIFEPVREKIASHFEQDRACPRQFSCAPESSAAVKV